jgi:hypothetical protein
MPVDAGDPEESSTVTLDAGSNSVSGGQAVKFVGSGNITPTTANDDDYVGVVQSKLSESDSKWAVHVCGQVVNVNADGSVDAGDTLVPSGSTDGQWVSHGNGMYESNPDSGGGAIAANHPFSLEDGSDGEVIRAVFR